ncbi:SNF2 family N-terminal domain-containing protein [Xylariaceae sp. FL1651]|nr:SNF2 family N-terminal domain-containing protein [Xylariaceae sp. FL1651]
MLAGRNASQPLVDQSITLQPQAFYKAVFVPGRESFTDLSTIPIPGLDTTLYPFQRRALQWLLLREGVKYSTIDSDGKIQLAPHPQPPTSTLPLSFRTLNDVNGQPFYVSDLYHIVTRDIAPFQKTENALRGGILAEEMGLGKTVEMISLILTHKRGGHSHTELDFYSGKVCPTGATLIVTPDTLQNQWLSEFKRHAPGLLVMKYPGIKCWANETTSDKDDEDEEGEAPIARFISKLANCDVVITTYNVLQTEIHYAVIPPNRSMRFPKQHERHTSPLVQIGWWRICLDEAQQIDSGVSSAAKVAKLIPRVNAWAVTGTPVKDNISDLWGLLLFLRYDPFASSPVIWKSLLQHHKTLFTSLFKRISIRHSKRAVRDELELPSQKRYVVTMPFTAIEEHHYQSQFESLLAEAGLNERGAPLHADWDPDDPYVVDLMKRALTNLRKTILHPELSSGSTRAVAHRTLVEHLETMIEQSDGRIKAELRNYLNTKLTRGQLLENSPRVKEALRIWEEVQEDIKPIIIECRESLRKALEIAHHEKKADNVGDDENSFDETFETAKVGECRRKLRLMLDVEHRAAFFIASAYFQIKSDEDLTQPGSDEYGRLEQREAEGYELAQSIRREILQEPLTKASGLMGKLKERAESQSFVEIPEIVTSYLHGLESGQIVENLESLAASLNEQADLIDAWREHVIQLLLKPLVDGEADAENTGEEYEDSTKVQDHLMVYTLALGAVISDRQFALSGLVNERINYETVIAERSAKDGHGHAPDKMLELLQLQRDAKPRPSECSLRGIVAALRGLSTTLRHDASAGSNRARVELKIVTTQLRTTQDILTKHTKVAASLERELDLFRATMNALSDNVTPVEKNERVQGIWDALVTQEDELKNKIRTRQANHCYLLNMRKEGTNSNEPCVICQSDFTLGTITPCGHQFCRVCIVYWLRAKHKCPVCKEHLTLAMLSDFNRNQPVLKIRQGRSRGHTNSHSPNKSKRTGIYSDFSAAKLQAIQNIRLDGPSYSTKVDTLIKHLLWLREEDPAAKSIIFTQFRSFLDILEEALKRYRIGFASFTTNVNKSHEIQRFKEDVGIECLLMDAKAHSSGLNLVNASHVFLCEPLLNTALELQAIARVDRIGQEHETTVWLYLIEDTVEEYIHNLSERRRLAHMGEIGMYESKKTTEEVSAMTLEAANSWELEQAAPTTLISKHGEGEAVDQRDLWECLFGAAPRGLREV